MVTSIFPLPTKRLIAPGVIYVLPALALALNAAVLNTFVRTIHQKQWGEKDTPHPKKTRQYGDISVKDEAVYLNGTKQFCLGKVKRKAIPFIIQLTRVTNELTVRRPLVIGGTFLFQVIGPPRESFQLPEETLMKEFWEMEEP